MAKKIPIGGELESISTGGIVADASSIRAGDTDKDTLDKELAMFIKYKEE